MGEKVCPVVAAIREIKGSSEYKRGGVARTCAHDVVFDNVMFLYNIRKLELARLELSRPDLLTLRARGYKYRTFRDVFDEIGAAPVHSRRAVGLAGDAIGALFAALAAKIARSRSANVTIPHLELPDVPPGSIGDIAAAVNNLVKFVNGVNVTSLLRGQPTIQKIKQLDLPALGEINMDTPTGVDAAAATSPDEIIAALKAALAAEYAVYVYAAGIEQFDCAAAAKTAEVVAAVAELTALLKPAPVGAANS